MNYRDMTPKEAAKILLQSWFEQPFSYSPSGSVENTKGYADLLDMLEQQLAGQKEVFANLLYKKWVEVDRIDCPSCDNDRKLEYNYCDVICMTLNNITSVLRELGYVIHFTEDGQFNLVEKP